MATRHLETDSLSNQNISSPLAVGAYTADADRWIACEVFADQVAGNGDYYLYLTLQINGAGSSYKSGITTLAAAPGVTSIFGQTVFIFVRSGDIVTAYLDGLAGDTTTPDTTVRWAELDALRPTVADRTADIASTGEIGLDFDNVKQASGATTLTNIRVPNVTLVDTTTNLTNAGSTTISSADMTTIAQRAWDNSYVATRNLTSTAAQTTAAVSGSDLAITRYVDYSATITGLTISASWTRAYLTIKQFLSAPDSEAVLQIVVSNPAASSTDGILYVNGAAASAAQRTQGSLTVTQGSGTIAIALTDDLTAVLSDGNYTWDLKILTATASAKPAGSGNVTISATETQSIA